MLLLLPPHMHCYCCSSNAYPATLLSASICQLPSNQLLHMQPMLLLYLLRLLC